MLVVNWCRENRNIRKQDPGETTYTVANIGGEKIFQIQTYGTPQRKSKGVASQTLQFTEEQAKELVKILTKEFNI